MRKIFISIFASKQSWAILFFSLTGVFRGL